MWIRASYYLNIYFLNIYFILCPYLMSDTLTIFTKHIKTNRQHTIVNPKIIFNNFPKINKYIWDAYVVYWMRFTTKPNVKAARSKSFIPLINTLRSSIHYFDLFLHYIRNIQYQLRYFRQSQFFWFRFILTLRKI